MGEAAHLERSHFACIPAADGQVASSLVTEEALETFDAADIPPSNVAIGRLHVVAVGGDCIRKIN